MAVFVLNWANISRTSIPVLAQLPDFEFTERSGQPFGTPQMQGKINVVDFIFTHCQGPCPIMASKLIELYHLYENSDRIQFVSISVDPERDSLARLRQYAENLGVTDNRWLFLRAPIDDVISLSEEGFMLAADDLPGGHSTKFVLVDHEGNIRGYYDSLDDNSLRLMKTHIKVLAQEMP
jgi:protein SCO1/2